MTFASRKKGILSRVDRSRKGGWDTRIIPLCDALNAAASFVTTSSCSGRILLTTVGARKHEADWLYSAHGEVALTQVQKALSPPPSDPVSFKLEPFIVHVECDGLEAARELLRLCNQAGLRRCGIISLGVRFVVEIRGMERMELPVAAGGELLVSQEYLGHLVNEANRKLRKNQERIDRLLAAFRTMKL